MMDYKLGIVHAFAGTNAIWIIGVCLYAMVSS